MKQFNNTQRLTISAISIAMYLALMIVRKALPSVSIKCVLLQRSMDCQLSFHSPFQPLVLPTL